MVEVGAFDLLKSLLTDAPVLACPDFSVKIVQTDASNYGLTQEIDGQERVIAYVNGKLDAAELNYSPPERVLGLCLGNSEIAMLPRRL